MKKVFKILLANNQIIFVEANDFSVQLDSIVDETTETYHEGVTQTGATEKLKEMAVKAVEIANFSMEKLTNAIVGFSSQIFEEFAKLPLEKKPDKLQIEYSIDITSGADVKIASASGKGAIKITAEWQKV